MHSVFKLTLIVLWFVSSGCGGNDRPAHGAAPSPQAVSPPPRTAMTDAPRVASADAVSQTTKAPSGLATIHEPPPAERRRVRTLLREARRLARAEEPAEAAERLTAAIAITPRDPRLRCELGFVLREEDPERAEMELRRGVALFGRHVPARLRRAKAMCLYNTGLVETELNHRDAAAEAFRRSLALRENARVRQRLLQMQLDYEPEGPLAAASLEDLVNTLRPRVAEECQDAGRECNESEVTLLAQHAATPNRPEVGWVMRTTINDMMQTNTYWVVFRSAEGYQRVEARWENEDNTDHGHIGESEVSLGDVSTPLPGWVRCDYNTTDMEGFDGVADGPDGEDAFCYGGDSTTATTRWALLCRVADLRCMHLKLLYTFESRSEVSCQDAEGEALEPQPAWTRERQSHSSGSWERSLEVAAGGVRLHGVRGTSGEEVANQPPLDEWVPLEEALTRFAHED